MTNRNLVVQFHINRMQVGLKILKLTENEVKGDNGNVHWDCLQYVRLSPRADYPISSKSLP
jgi:hypothetical protein